MMSADLRMIDHQMGSTPGAYHCPEPPHQPIGCTRGSMARVSWTSNGTRNSVKGKGFGTRPSQYLPKLVPDSLRFGLHVHLGEPEVKRLYR